MTNPAPTPIVVNSSPDPTPKELALEAVQWAFAVVGICGVTLPPAVTSLQSEQVIAGLVLSGASLAMAIYRKFRSTQNQHASAQQSAKLGRAVRVI